MKLNYFNFKHFGTDILITNDFGKYMFVSDDELKRIVSKNVDMKSDFAQRLIENKIIYDETNFEYSAENKYLLRNVKGYINNATALHIFVVTTCCNMKCVYCQANNGVKDSHIIMNKVIAKHAVDIALQSPQYVLTFEFQGGEPLMNFEIISYIVEYAESRKGQHKIYYTIVTNLTLLTDEMVEFFLKYDIGISTSIDGNEILNNTNRTLKDGKGTFNTVVKSLDKLRSAGVEVGAIQTTTKYSLKYAKDIIKTYVDLGFSNIFIRPLTLLGKAALYRDEIGYSAEEFIEFYKEALNILIDINKNGYYIREGHATIFLKKMKGEFVNYMELRSPCGAAMGQLAYYADGNIFTCDEGRMLYEMGNSTFCLGNVFENKYEDLIENTICKTVCASSILESIPSCCDCVYQPYCGVCPVANFAMNQDIMEKYPKNYKCKIYGGILDLLFEKYYIDDEETIEIFNSWSC